MSDLLAIGRSGVVAYRAALSTIGENVSNADTEGYTRRTVSLGEAAIPAGNRLYISSALFGGVSVTGVQRVYDAYRSSYARFSTSEAERAEARAVWLGTAEAALDDSDVGLGVKMAAVFNAAEALSADVTSDANRRHMLNALTAAATQFNGTAEALASAATGISSTARNSVELLNSDLRNLAEINQSLQRATPGSAGQALLEDQRDATLLRLSKIVGIDVQMRDDGRAEVRLSGNGGVTLVAADQPFPSYVGMVENGDGRFSLIVSGFDSQQAVSPQSGSLAGLIEAAGIVASRREELDAVAERFATVINEWNMAGTDRNGDPGVALITGTSAATIGATQTDVAKLALALGGVANGNALALKDYRNAEGPEARWSLLVSTHAQAVSAAKAERAAAGSQRDGALQQLDEITGVDLDVEAAQLLRYQQAYNGSARIIQIARETLQEILNLFS